MGQRGKMMVHLAPCASKFMFGICGFLPGRDLAASHRKG